MGNLKYKDDEQRLQDNDWGCLDKQLLHDLLDHVANILAEEYVERMKRAP